MKTRTVKREVDLSSLPPLTAAQEAELAELEALDDSRIDTSEIPLLSDEFWAHAERGRFQVPPKRQVTLRIDADVLDYFKQIGSRYQTRINAVLRAFVEAEKKAQSGKP